MLVLRAIVTSYFLVAAGYGHLLCFISVSNFSQFVRESPIGVADNNPSTKLKNR